ncbi:hypothetical protein ACN42_g7133 [Penicillium freii]|uniref:Uncharacterized protein n=1 Tax=Penicillium freii TaxID=48697 RepID=A0A101MG70_PENFR|nr:hypothetical protein ACN42_g7133 [Penicillium freii]
MCLRSLKGIYHSQLGSTPLGVGPPENHRLSNFSPGTLLLLDFLNLFNFYIPLENFRFGFWWFPVSLTAYLLGLTSYFYFRLRTLQTNSAFDAIFLRFSNLLADADLAFFPSRSHS